VKKKVKEKCYIAWGCLVLGEWKKREKSSASDCSK
jgi:hypothetical protein